ncbi:MAG TPA: hypothetical protein VFG73_01870 [Rhodanobacteraceae bacterium]|nr:hypothetical protein [Rhodanobacteraceae bacterium]
MSRGALRRNLSDAAFLFLVPAVVALLPWSWGFALLRRLARSPSLFADVVASNLAQARRRLPALDAAAFAHQCRLLLLVDRCDSALALLRGERWWRRHVAASGDAVAGGLLLTSHWGAGFWIWRWLAAVGIHAHFVVRRADASDVGRGALSRLYLRWRAWSLTRIGCRGAIFSGGGGGEKVRAALAAGDSVLGMLDLPASLGQRAQRVRWLGGEASLPLGLAEIAAQAGVAVQVLSCSLDPVSGQRQLHAECLPPNLDAAGVVAAYAAHIETRIRERPGAWHLWHALPLYAGHETGAASGET